MLMNFINVLNITIGHKSGFDSFKKLGHNLQKDLRLYIDKIFKIIFGSQFL